MNDINSKLFSHQNWSFFNLKKVEPERVNRLEEAPSPDIIKNLLDEAFEILLKENKVNLGLEKVDNNDNDYRLVLQFQIDSTLFDWIFNGRTGYRAHLASDYATGLQFNLELLNIFSKHLQKMLPESVKIKRINREYEQIDETDIDKSKLIISLDGYWGKVCLCTKLIEENNRQLPSGTTGPKLVVNDKEWYDIHPDDGLTWIEIKGAFLGKDGPYQVKFPEERIDKMKENGSF